jgi:hypothetical protein
MDITSFFNQLDDTARSKDIAQKASEAKSRIITETAVSFANKLSELTVPYEKEFERRGWKCEKRTGNIPYWSLEVRNTTNQKRVKIAIVNSNAHQYEVATYSNDDRTNNNIFISDSFDKSQIEEAIQHLITYLI